MIQINIKENESLDKALKRFKKKFEKNRCCKGTESKAGI
jgi:ribosomal protein S21